LPDRWEVPAARLGRWLDRWAAAHPDATASATPDALTLTAPDGAAVECRPVIPGLPDGAAVPELLAHVTRERRVGVLLVRLGAHACGVFEGDRLVTHKVDRRLVHGRNRAGGQSQRRFERRRAGQARQSLQAAADLAARMLAAERLDALVTGGDRGAVAEVLADRRLAGLAALAVPHTVDVPEPRLEVLESMRDRISATLISAR